MEFGIVYDFANGSRSKLILGYKRITKVSTFNNFLNWQMH